MAIKILKIMTNGINVNRITIEQFFVYLMMMTMMMVIEIKIMTTMMMC